TRAEIQDGSICPYYGAAIKDQAIVAIDKARHVGDVIAAVVAETPEIASEAAALVEVDYEELPAVFDALKALQPNAPLVHEQIVDHYEIPPNAGIRPVNGTNLINQMRIRRGDVELGMRESDLVFEEVYSSPALQHCALEPHVTVARWETPNSGQPELTIWSATQMPHFVRQQVADVFRMPVEQ